MLIYEKTIIEKETNVLKNCFKWLWAVIFGQIDGRGEIFSVENDTNFPQDLINKIIQHN